MGTWFIIATCVLLSSGKAFSQESGLSQILSSVSFNNLAAGGSFQPGTIANLTGLLNYLNTTGNVTGVVETLSGNPQLTSAATTLLFEGLSFSTLTNNGVNDECQRDLVVFLEEFAKSTSWALKMFDAYGKPGSNLASGLTKFIGSYEECVAINALAYLLVIDGKQRQRTSFRGKYCSLEFILPGFPEPIRMLGAGYVQLGVCVPDTCGNLDVQILGTILERVLFNQTVPYPTTARCQEDSKPLGTDAMIAVCILAILGCLVVFATVYDIIAVQMKSTKNVDMETEDIKIKDIKIECISENSRTVTVQSSADVQSNIEQGKRKSPEEHSHREKDQNDLKVSNCEKTLETKRSTLEETLLAFSFYTNATYIMGVNKRDSLETLAGIRFFSMAWVILCHSPWYTKTYSANTVVKIQENLNKWTLSAVMYSDVAVDTFFATSGLLVSYLTLKAFQKLGGPGRLNWFLFYLHRYLRITPVYMLVMMFGTVLLPYMMHGPMWNQDYVLKTMEDCRKHWWNNLLYLNNYLNQDEICMGWSWYLANDMQFYCLSPLLLIPLFYYVGVGLVLCILLVIGSSIAVGMVTHHHRIPVQPYHVQYHDNIISFNDQDKYIYHPSYARIGPYVIGILTGYVLYRYKQTIKIPLILNLAGWLMTIAFTSLIVYGRYTEDDKHIFSRLESDIFMALFRTGWGIAVCWIVFACETGHGGWIKRMLSWKAFIPLGRITFCTYLVHPLVMVTFYSSRMVLSYMTHYEWIYLFLGHLTMSFGVAFIVSATIEYPLREVEKITIGRLLNRKKQREHS